MQCECSLRHGILIFSLACKCDDAARAKNKERKESEQYAGFALHYWGECYGKTRAQLNALMAKGESHRCTGSQKYDGCRKEHNECVGHEFAEVIYEFKAAAPKGTLHFLHHIWTMFITLHRSATTLDA